MNMKKTWFSYCTWGSMIVFAVTMLWSSLDQLSVIPDRDSAFVLWGVRIVSVVLPCILFALIFKLSSRWESGRNIEISRKACIITETAVFLGMLLAFFMLRIGCINSLQDFSFVKDSMFYQAASIGAGQVSMIGAHPVAFYVYREILAAVLFLFGNRAEAVVILQIVLQFLSVTALYFAGRMFFHRWYGAIPALAVSVIPVFTDNIVNLNYENLILFFFSAWFLLFALFYRNDRTNHIKTAVMGIVTGLLSAFWYGFAGLFILVLVYGMEQDSDSLKERVADLALLVLTAVSVYGLIYFLVPVSFQSSSVIAVHTVVFSEGMVYLAVSVFLFAYCISFLLKQNDCGHLFAVPVITGFLMLHFTAAFSSMHEFIFFTLPLLFLIITDFISYFYEDGFTRVYEDTHPVPESDDEFILKKPDEENSVNEEKTKKTGKWKDRMKKKRKDIDENPLETAEKLTHEAETVSGEEEENREDEQEVIRVSDILKKNHPDAENEDKNIFEHHEETVIDRKAQIENVLPMPKKHVSRSIDYEYEVRPEDMHFDVELNSSNDHYDYY